MGQPCTYYMKCWPNITVLQTKQAEKDMHLIRQLINNQVKLNTCKINQLKNGLVLHT